MDNSDTVPLNSFLWILTAFKGFGFDDLIFVFIYILIFGILLLVTAFIVSSEVAFFSITPDQKKELEKSSHTKDAAILKFLNRPKEFISTILLSNILLYTLMIFTADKLLNLCFDFTDNHIVRIISVLLFVWIFRLVFGEVISKIYAMHNNLLVAKKSLAFIRIFNFILKPFVSAFLFVGTFTEQKLKKYNRLVLADELDQALEQVSPQNSTQTLAEKNLLKGIVNFSSIYVTEIMKARVDVIYVDTSMNFGEVLETVRNSGYSRIPVINGDLDKTVGIIYVKDLLPYLNHGAKFDWHTLIRTALFVPESKKIEDLLKEFKVKRVHMAIVVDEYGGTSGLVTLEDVMEEVIGEIKDEFDDIHEINYRKIDPFNYIFEGKTGVSDACKIMNIPIDSFEKIRGDADTIAGMILEIKGEMPSENEKINVDDYTFAVIETNATRIVKVKITIHEP